MNTKKEKSYGQVVDEGIKDIINRRDKLIETMDKDLMEKETRIVGLEKYIEQTMIELTDANYKNAELEEENERLSKVRRSILDRIALLDLR